MHRSTLLTAPALPGSEAASAPNDHLPDLRRRIDAALGGWLAIRRATLAAEVPEVEELVAAVGRLVEGGGKRLRPALVEAAWRAAGGTDATGPPDFAAAAPTGVTALGLATELLHTYLLIHDDIMDHAPLRRGVTTVHERFAAEHHARDLKGDAGDFGATVAILAGDLVHSWAHELFAKAVAPLDDAGRRTALATCFAAMTEEVVAGQYLEVLLASRGAATAEQLGRVLRLKSGRYSVERPLELGARYAGAGDELVAALARCGRALGEAFQLQDDLLGTFGEVSEVGKPVASDLAEGKVTFLVHHALTEAPAADAERLAAALGSGELDAATAADLRRVIEASGARERVEAMAAERLATARGALAEAAAVAPRSATADEGFELLGELLEHLSGRRR